MSQQELLTEVIATLRKLGIEFMLTGSHASSLQGEARATHDIDLVARLSAKDVQPLLQAFHGDRFYLSEPDVSDAIRSRSMRSGPRAGQRFKLTEDDLLGRV